MVKGKTNSGFEFTLEDETLDDYELLEVLQEIDAGAYEKTTGMVKMLLGEEQKNALKDHISDEHGRVSTTRLMEEVMEIFEESNKGKNS